MTYQTKTNYCCKNLENYNNRRKRKVVQILDGQVIKVFESLASVADDGFDYSNVAKCCRELRATAGGYQWKYID